MDGKVPAWQHRSTNPITRKCFLFLFDYIFITPPNLSFLWSETAEGMNTLFFKWKQKPVWVAFLERSWDLTSSAREGETGQDKANGAYERATGRGRGKRNRQGRPHGSGKVVGGEAEGFIHVMPYISYLIGQAFFMLIRVLVVLNILYDIMLCIRVKI